MPMSRNHIHFATKEPDRMPSLGTPKADEIKPEQDGADKVMSGMRAGATVMIWVDVRKSLEGGVKWWRSENNVLLTDGLEGMVKGEDGMERKGRVLGFEWIRWVEKRNRQELLWKAEGVDVEKERSENAFRKVMGGDVTGGVNGEKSLEGQVRGLNLAETNDGKRDGGSDATQGSVKQKEVVKESWDD